MDNHDLTGANLASQNLTNAIFYGATLTGASLSGADARGANFQNATLSGANLSQANLTNADFYFSTLTNANFSQANLTNANLEGAALTGANLSGAEVRGAIFKSYYGYDSGITVAQLYSTASYLAHDLTGINLVGNNLAGANLVGQNLTNAGFGGAVLTGANLTGAEVRGASFSREDRGVNGSGITVAQLYSTASYQAHDLTGIRLDGNDLTGENFIGQNLTNAYFDSATLTNADFSQANLTNAGFRRATLTNANFNQANLTNADFAGFDYYYVGANLTGANLSQANLTNANFSGFENCDEYDCYPVPGANLTNANLSGADARGANFDYATLTGANTSNRIQSNGHIAGLDLTAGASLVVRDYDGNPFAAPPAGPLPIVVEQHLATDATGTLRLVFDADPWDSLISFAPGIPASLGGTLELAFAPGVNVATQSGRTIDLFDWTGVTPTGAFTVSSPYTWNLANLYTTGEVTLTSVPRLVPGDFNHDGTVDAADYVVWRKGVGVAPTPANYHLWRAHFGETLGNGSGATANATIPEPATLVMLIVAAAASIPLRRRRITYRVPGTRLRVECSIKPPLF